MTMTVFKPLFALALGGFATATSAQDLPPSAPRAVTMIGRSDNELILSKIAVTDFVRSYDFYTRVIGLKLASPQLQPPKRTDPQKDFAEFPLNHTGTLADPFFVIYQRKGQVVTPAAAANSVIGFKVPDARAAVARAVAAGARPVGNPPGAGPMAFGMVSDPDGYTIEFVQAASNPAR
jgi:catechol 2,3-dioxygenase-like lactoylglutathione lyase family enzyme